MWEFAAASLAFLASHSVPAAPRVRARLVAVLGETLYLLLYAATSLLILAWLLGAAGRAPILPLWSLGLGAYWVPLVVMPFALFLLIAGVLCPNPLSVGFRGMVFQPASPGIVGITRHPILWGLSLWAGSHVVANGDLVSTIMFGGFALFALAAMPMIDARRQRQLGMGWNARARGTSIMPFGAFLQGGGARASWPAGVLPVSLIATAAMFLLFLVFHAPLFGPDPTIVLSWF
jgi:uncharacterized membrane protein